MRLTGVLVALTPGFTIALKRKVTPGGDPSTLVLEKEVTAPEGIVAQVLTPTPVLYREVTEERITRVTILPDHDIIAVQEVG